LLFSKKNREIQEKNSNSN
jgi:hypothetical protein